MGTLFIVSTPIGNLKDITYRAVETLLSVDVIACEDTRVSGGLLDKLRHSFVSSTGDRDIPRFVSYRNENEQIVSSELIHALKTGSSVALISDAGTPLISDPGYRIVRDAIDHGIPMQIIPGVSAITAALAGSGLALNRFTFIGYLPDTKGKRLKLLDCMKRAQQLLPTTYCIYIPPHAFRSVLGEILSVFGDVACVTARELTKMHEEFYRGTVRETMDHFSAPKGECTVMVSCQS